MAKPTFEVLLIEENLTDAALVKDMLANARNAEFLVLHMEHLAEGLDLLKSRTFHAILIGVALSDSTGLEGSLAVRNQAQNTPVVVLTNLNDEDIAVKALDLDIQDYLIKEEINSSVLIRSVQYAIQRKRITAQLRESEECYHATFDHAAVGIGQVALDGRLQRINQKYCDIVGYTQEEMKTLNIRDITHPDDQESSMKLFQRLFEGEIGNYTLEKRYIRKDGSTIWIRLTASMVFDADGKPCFAVGVVEDITLRKRAEEALRFSEARYQALFRDNPVMIITLDTDFTMLSVNPTCARQLGYTIAELEGQSVLMLFCGEDRPAVANQLRQCLENPNKVYSWQFQKICKAKQILWVEEVAQAVYDLNGKINILVVCQDISGRKRAEDALKDSERFKQAILDSLLAHIAVLDKNGLVIAVNKSWIRFAEENGLPDASSVCRGADYLAVCRKAVDAADPLAQEALEGIEAVLSGTRDAFALEYPCNSRTQERWFLMNVVRPTYDFQGAVITHLDVTDRRRAEDNMKRLMDQVTRSNRELEQFAYVASHDLQEPLRMVSSYVQLLKKKYLHQLDEKAEAYLNYALDGTTRMQSLIEGLLKYSRITTAQFSPVETNVTFKDATANLSNIIDDSHAVVTSGELPTVMGDATQLLQLFQNLLSNALKYRKPGVPPNVTFSAKQTEEHWLFAVEDNGIGIEPENSEKVFDIFQRLHTKEEYPGTGIGLASCKKIVEQHQGRIWLEASPGVGTTFFFTLPIRA